MPAPASLPNPIDQYLIGLHLSPPTESHGPSFFDPPTNLTTRLGPVVEEAKKFIHALLPPWGESHVYRTYAFSLAIAECAGWSKPGPEADRLGWDKEMCFLAAILHDVGFDSLENPESRLSFEIFGGVKSRELLLKWGAPQEVADELCESIIRHTDILVNTGGIRLMGALIQLGAGHDLMGLATPSWIHPEDNRIVCERWPRFGFSSKGVGYIEQEIAHRPGCLATKWFDALIPKMKDVKCFEGLEGEFQEDKEWKERREALDF